MNIFTGFLLIICSLFYAYKTIIRIIRYKKELLEKDKNNVKLINIDFDKRFHSSPSFDFPNVQSESDLKILNSGSDPCGKQDEIKVKQYCKY